jgi:hypothetical protein
MTIGTGRQQRPFSFGPETALRFRQQHANERHTAGLFRLKPQTRVRCCRPPPCCRRRSGPGRSPALALFSAGQAPPPAPSARLPRSGRHAVASEIIAVILPPEQRRRHRRARDQDDDGAMQGNMGGIMGVDDPASTDHRAHAGARCPSDAPAMSATSRAGRCDDPRLCPPFLQRRSPRDPGPCPHPAGSATSHAADWRRTRTWRPT